MHLWSRTAIRFVGRQWPGHIWSQEVSASAQFPRRHLLATHAKRAFASSKTSFEPSKEGHVPDIFLAHKTSQLDSIRKPIMVEVDNMIESFGSLDTFPSMDQVLEAMKLARDHGFHQQVIMLY